MKTIVSGAAVICGIGSAVLWFLAARSQPAPLYVGFPLSPDEAQGLNEEFCHAYKIASRLNAWAAMLTGGSVFLSSLGSWVAS